MKSIDSYLAEHEIKMKMIQLWNDSGLEGAVPECHWKGYSDEDKEEYGITRAIDTAEYNQRMETFTIALVAMLRREAPDIAEIEKEWKSGDKISHLHDRFVYALLHEYGESLLSDVAFIWSGDGLPLNEDGSIDTVLVDAMARNAERRVRTHIPVTTIH